MWVVKIVDRQVRREQFVRDNFYDGALLYFDHEEDAVRMGVLLTQLTQVYYGVQCVARRFDADPRKEKLKRIEAARIERVFENLSAML